MQPPLVSEAAFGGLEVSWLTEVRKLLAAAAMPLLLVLLLLLTQYKQAKAVRYCQNNKRDALSTF
jgi:hypothetical protein